MINRCLVIMMLSAALSAESILCLGDSLTAGYGLDEAQAWPAVAQELATADGKAWTFINGGVSGDTTEAARNRLDWALRAKPTVVVIALGGNDGLRGLDPTTTEANLRFIIQRVQERGARPIVAGMQLPTNFGEEYRQAFAAIYPLLATELAVPLIPFLLEGVGGERELNQSDQIHPNAAGQQRVAATVYAALGTALP